MTAKSIKYDLTKLYWQNSSIRKRLQMETVAIGHQDILPTDGHVITLRQVKESSKTVSTMAKDSTRRHSIQIAETLCRVTAKLLNYHYLSFFENIRTRHLCKVFDGYH